MSKAKLKKALAAMNAEQLATVILDAYDNSNDFKIYFEYWLNPDPEKLAEKAKAKLTGRFITKAGHPAKRPGAQKCDRIVNDFAALAGDADYICDLRMLYAVMLAQWIDLQSSRTKYRVWAERTFRNAAISADASSEPEMHKARLKHLLAYYRELYCNFNFSED